MVIATNSSLYARPAPSHTHRWDKSVDVVVVGSGFAGLMAAIQAVQLGVSVVVIEKRAACGGNSIISDGVLAGTGCTLQKKAHIADSAARLLSDMLKAGRHANQPDLVTAFAENTADVCDWLIQELGVAFRPQVYQFPGHSVARSLTPMKSIGSSLIKPMLHKLRALGVTPKTGWQMTQLSITHHQGVNGIRVNGIRIEPSLKRTREEGLSAQWIQARKAVILATGGFSADVQFRQQLDSKLNENIGCTNLPSATAEGLKEAIRIGADTVDLDNIQLAPFTSPDEKGYGVAALLASYVVFPYGVLIHPQTGQRFVNELADRKTQVDAFLSIGSPCIGIADAQGVERSEQPIDKCLQRKVVRRFNSLTDLTAYYEIPYPAISDSLERYNDLIVQGHDHDFDKPILKNASPLKPPYYAVRLWPKVHYTMGGLRINAAAQVLNTNGEVIDGLYAAGEVTGGIHGTSRLSTAAITECFVFGRIAGQQAAMSSCLNT